MILPAGTVKRIHVDRRVMAQNRRDGTVNPAITVQTSKGAMKAKKATVLGTSEMIYRPLKPLSCGARAWLETRAAVEVFT